MKLPGLHGYGCFARSLTIIILMLVIALFAVSAFADQAVLRWSAVTQNEDGSPCTDLGGYNIYLHEGAYTKLGTVSSGILAYTDSGITVPNNTTITRCYVVTAFDASGNESAYSNEVCKSFFGIDIIAPGKPFLSVN